MVCNVSIVASKENEKKWYLNPSSNNFQRGDWCPMRLVNVAGHYAESFYFYFFWPFISLQTILKTTKWDCYTKLFLYSIKEQNLFNPKSLSLSLPLFLSLNLNFLSTPYLSVIVQGLYLLYNDMTEKGCWFCSANVEKEIEKPLIRINITCAPMVKQASIYVEFLIRLQIIFSLYISHKLHASLSSVTTRRSSSIHLLFRTTMNRGLRFLMPYIHNP